MVGDGKAAYDDRNWGIQAMHIWILAPSKSELPQKLCPKKMDLCLGIFRLNPAFLMFSHDLGQRD